jgi:hypothetical protein
MTIPGRIIQPLTLASLFLVAPGCGRDRGSAGAPDDHQVHAGHVIPAHKPKAFPDAVRRLEELDGAIARGSADDKTLSMVADIAGWLPEIAAESDMPEGPWDEVNRLSAALVEHYWKLMNSTPGGRKGATRDVAALATVLEKSDLRWFDRPIGKP